MGYAASKTFMAIAVLMAVAGPVAAQSLDDTTVDSIVGSDVKQDETTAAAREAEVISAIDRTTENTEMVRKTSSVDQVDIVLLSDTARGVGGPPGPIADRIKAHESDIAELREEIEANALLFHAIDSRRVLTQDVLAVAFKGPKKVIVYAAAKPAG